MSNWSTCLAKYRPTCSRCPAFIIAPESLRTGMCLGCRSPGPEQVVTTPARPAQGLTEIDYCPLGKPVTDEPKGAQ